MVVAASLCVAIFFFLVVYRAAGNLDRLRLKKSERCVLLALSSRNATIVCY